jgi:hypothetical protein
VLHENQAWGRQSQEPRLSDSLVNTVSPQCSTDLIEGVDLHQYCNFGAPGWLSEAVESSLREQTHAAPMHHMSSTQNVPPQSNLQEPSSSSSDQTDSTPATTPPETVNFKSNIATIAFLPHSPFPNGALAHFLDLIKTSAFIWFNQFEPSINSEAGQDLLRTVSNHHGCPPIPDQHSGQSIYILMVDRSTKQCLMCGQTKSSLERAITCIRTHLGHKPFVCGGYSAKCLTCGKKTM